MRWLKTFLKDECGTTAVEYAVMLGMILMVIFASIVSFGQAQNMYWGGINNNLKGVGF